MREGLRFAWTVEGYSDWKRKDDPRYVKLLMRIGGRKNGESIEEIIDFHRCTDKDFEQFAPPSADAEKTLKKIMQNEDRGLFCIDWEKFGKNMRIFGTSHYTDFRFIDVELVPCQYVHNLNGYELDKPTPECLYDKKGAEEYLSNLRFYVYISEARFKQNGFDDETITRQTKFYSQQVDSKFPSYLPGMLKTNFLQDESEYF